MNDFERYLGEITFPLNKCGFNTMLSLVSENDLINETEAHLQNRTYRQ